MAKQYLYFHCGKYHFSKSLLEGTTIYETNKLSLIECFSQSVDERLFCDFESIDFPLEIQTAVLEVLGKLFFIMPEGIDGRDYIPKCFLPKDIESNEVTIFGGSFNPWHEGHAECLRQCSKYEDNILLFPDYSPWKENLNTGPLSNLLSLSDKTDRSFPIYPGFWSKEDRNPTESWIEEVRCSRVNWLMGDDTFLNLMKWLNVEKVINKLSKIYVVPREHKNHDVSELRLIHEQVLFINPHLEICYLEDHPFRGVSSSGIRG